MRVGFARFDSENSVQQEHALGRPLGKVPVVGGFEARHVGFEQFVDVLQTWRDLGLALGNGETEPHSLVIVDVGVLTDDYDFNPVEGGELKGIEDLVKWRVTGLTLVLLGNKSVDAFEVGLLGFESLLPTVEATLEIVKGDDAKGNGLWGM